MAGKLVCVRFQELTIKDLDSFLNGVEVDNIKNEVIDTDFLNQYVNHALIGGKAIVCICQDNSEFNVGFIKVNVMHLFITQSDDELALDYVNVMIFPKKDISKPHVMKAYKDFYMANETEVNLFLKESISLIKIKIVMDS